MPKGIYIRTDIAKENIRKSKLGTKHRWLGMNAGIGAKHAWIHKHYGKANHCEHCGLKNKKKYEWANISQEYKREVTDYIQLCTSCHRLMDVRSKPLCKNGHLKTAETQYFAKNGMKLCRICMSDRQRKYYQKMKQKNAI